MWTALRRLIALIYAPSMSNDPRSGRLAGRRIPQLGSLHGPKAHARARRASLRTARPLTGLLPDCEAAARLTKMERWTYRQIAADAREVTRVAERPSRGVRNQSRADVQRVALRSPDSKAAAWPREVRALGIDVPM